MESRAVNELLFFLFTCVIPESDVKMSILHIIFLRSSKERKSQSQHNSMNLWSTLLSFIFIAYSVMKGEIFCFHWSYSTDLQIIPNTTYLNLEILVLMELIFIIEFMLLWERDRYDTRCLVFILSDRKTR